MRSVDPRYAWMLGTGRCGSTLVHEVLARHPDVGFLSNVEDNVAQLGWTGRWNGPLFRRVPNSLTAKGRLRFAPSEAYGLLERRVSPMLATPFRDLTAADATPWLADRFRGVFEDAAMAQGRPLFLHKFTGWPRAGFTETVFPDSRFIHVVRDGRAVASSWMQMDWWLGHRGPWDWPWGPLTPAQEAEWQASGQSFAVLAGIAWKILMDAFDAAQAKVPSDRWLEVRYEDILDNPRECFAELLDFLDLPWNRRFEQALARYDFRRDAVGAFRRHLDQPTLAQLDRCLAEHLARRGYFTTDHEGLRANL